MAEKITFLEVERNAKYVLIDVLINDIKVTRQQVRLSDVLMNTADKSAEEWGWLACLYVEATGRTEAGPVTDAIKKAVLEGLEIWR